MAKFKKMAQYRIITRARKPGSTVYHLSACHTSLTLPAPLPCLHTALRPPRGQCCDTAPREDRSVFLTVGSGKARASLAARVTCALCREGNSGPLGATWGTGSHSPPLGSTVLPLPPVTRRPPHLTLLACWGRVADSPVAPHTTDSWSPKHPSGLCLPDVT